MSRTHRQISITLDLEVFGALEVAREAAGVSRSAIIETALAKHLAVTLSFLVSKRKGPPVIG